MMFVHRMIDADLGRRDQLETGTSHSAEAREVLAELKTLGYDYRSVKGLDEALDLNEAQIRNALKELEQIPKLLWSGQIDGQECWVLSVRRPGWWKRNGLFKRKPRIG
jgi:hypothetical protein